MKINSISMSTGDADSITEFIVELENGDRIKFEEANPDTYNFILKEFIEKRVSSIEELKDMLMVNEL